MEITGKAHQIGATETKGVNNFKVKKIIIDRTWFHPEDGRPITNFTEVTLTGDKTALADNLQIGDKVKATIRINGRFFEHEGEQKFAQDVVCSQFTITEKAKDSTDQSGKVDPETKEHY